jgi:hypothetical protein
MRPFVKSASPILAHTLSIYTLCAHLNSARGQHRKPSYYACKLSTLRQARVKSDWAQGVHVMTKCSWKQNVDIELAKTTKRVYKCAFCCRARKSDRIRKSIAWNLNNLWSTGIFLHWLLPKNLIFLESWRQILHKRAMAIHFLKTSLSSFINANGRQKACCCRKTHFIK